MELASGALIVGPLRAVLAVVHVISEFTERIHGTAHKERVERRRDVQINPLFNYGALNSVREALSSGLYLHYFQQSDGDFCTKLLDRSILDTICCFLQDHNIDTSELRERETTILNSGIIVQGGDVKADTLAVGAGAQAVKTEKGRFGRRAEQKAAS